MLQNLELSFIVSTKFDTNKSISNNHAETASQIFAIFHPKSAQAKKYIKPLSYNDLHSGFTLTSSKFHHLLSS